MNKIVPEKQEPLEKVLRITRSPGKKYLKKLEIKQNKGKTKWLSLMIFHPESIFRLSWDVTMLLIIIYQAFTIPYFICFEEDYPINLQYFEIIVNLIFFLDILLTFNTAFYSKGTLVSKKGKIALEYLKMWFWLDLITCFPYDWIVEGVFPSSSSSKSKTLYTAPKIIRIIRIIRFLKILRLLRLAKLKKILIKIEDYIASTTIATLFIYGRLLSMCFLGAHWIACLFYYVANQLSDSHPITWITIANIEDSPNYEKYVTSLYWAFSTIATVGFGDIYPVTMYEKLFVIITMIISSGAFAYTVGIIGAMLSKHTEIESFYRDAFVSVNKYIKAKHLPRDLQLRVKRYLDYIWEKNKKDNVNEKELLAILSEPLRDEIYAHINANVVKFCRVFERFDSHFLSHLTRALDNETHAPLDFIFEEGEMSHKIYYILSGKAKVYHSATKSCFAVLSPQNFFGEIAFFLGKARCASVICYEFSDLVSLNRTDFLKVLERFPEAKEITKNLIQLCQDGDYSSLNVSCYICDELGHIASKCKEVLINLNQDDYKKKWIENKIDDARVSVTISKSLSPKYERKNRKKLKVRYGISNLRGSTRGSFDMYPNSNKLGELVHDCADFKKFDLGRYWEKLEEIEEEPEIKPSYTLFIQSESDTETADKPIVKITKV